MWFNSMAFVEFFVVVATAFFLLPRRWQVPFLLVASYYFYMAWEPAYALLIVTSTLVDYIAGIQLARTRSPRARTGWLIFSLTMNLGLLFTFKYFNFVSSSIRDALGAFAISLDTPFLDVLLPVGISFYTFQTLSYTIDVYRGRLQPEYNFFRFALYVSFFPQLVAGPIERGVNLLPQLRQPKGFDPQRAYQGLQLMLWGLFKKVVIADRLAIYVDVVYNNVELHNGPTFILATYLFAFQIYCDFSGYSDIAIGAARLLGVDLMKNFRRPYFATSIVDFWRRWHISLSTWLRDYLYIPLGGNRCGTRRMYVNLMITMILGGIWHGAAWTFIIWGILHGVMLCASKWTMPLRDRLCTQWRIPAAVRKPLAIVITFHLVCLAWIFFRANSLQDALYILRQLPHGWPYPLLKPMALAHGLLGILALIVVQMIQAKHRDQSIVELPLPLVARWSLCLAGIFAIVLFGIDNGSQFIYFAF